MPLRDVALVIADCVNPTLAVKAIQRCTRSLEFGEVKFLSHERPDLPRGVEFVQIPKMTQLRDYARLSLESLGSFVTSEFVLNIHTDGFVVNPALWDDRFLDCDYIGAPWPADASWVGTSQVGNSGFCLRSRRFLDYVRRLVAAPRAQWMIDNGCADDVMLCNFAVEHLRETGFVIAPLELASKFSFEQAVDGCAQSPAETFGFHGQLTAATLELCEDLKAEIG
jgi:hypothetical protein